MPTSEEIAGVIALIKAMQEKSYVIDPYDKTKGKH